MYVIVTHVLFLTLDIMSDEVWLLKMKMLQFWLEQLHACRQEGQPRRRLFARAHLGTGCRRLPEGGGVLLFYGDGVLYAAKQL